MNAIKFWFFQVALAFDQFCNAVFGGWADESISSRAWRLSAGSHGWACLRACIDTIFRAFGQRDHCFEAWTSERMRTQLPPELRAEAT
jgi:hypothetical protein